MSEVLVRASGVSFRRAGRDVLDDLSFEIRRGESVALVGPSGSGKSALLALLAGLERPDTGELTIGVTRKEIGLVLQGYGLVGLLTVEENVAMPLLTAGRAALTAVEVRKRARYALHDVGLADLSDRLVETVSGGQQQRVAIARATITQPALLLADELSAALDHGTRQQVLSAVLDLHQQGATLVTATHDPAVAAVLQRRLILQDGHLTADER